MAAAGVAIQRQLSVAKLYGWEERYEWNVYLEMRLQLHSAKMICSEINWRRGIKPIKKGKKTR